MPAHLFGIRDVEEWISPAEPRPSGGDDVAAAYQREAGRRLATARLAWQRDQRRYTAASVADITPVRPVVSERDRDSRVAAEITEQRAWALAGHRARVEFEDVDAFVQQVRP